MNKEITDKLKRVLEDKKRPQISPNLKQGWKKIALKPIRNKPRGRG